LERPELFIAAGQDYLDAPGGRQPQDSRDAGDGLLRVLREPNLGAEVFR
jgi:hypothetical protein